MSPSTPSFSPPLNLSPQPPRAISPLSIAFTPNRPLTPLSTAFTKAHRGVGAPLRQLRVLCASALSLPVDFLTLYFHILTNCFSRNSFILITMRVAPGCHPAARLYRFRNQQVWKPGEGVESAPFNKFDAFSSVAARPRAIRLRTATRLTLYITCDRRNRLLLRRE